MKRSKQSVSDSVELDDPELAVLSLRSRMGCDRTMFMLNSDCQSMEVMVIAYGIARFDWSVGGYEYIYTSPTEYSTLSPCD